MTSSITSASPKQGKLRLWIATACLGLLSAGAYVVLKVPPAQVAVASEKPAEAKESTRPAPAGSATTEVEVLQLPKEAWKAAGLEMGPVEASMFQDHVKVTGKITFNEDRIAHVFPQVAGRIEQVHVSLGQKVKAGQPLVSIESPEIGTARLNLHRNRLLCEFATRKDAWIQEVSKNTHALVESLRKNPGMEEIEAGFRDRRLGRNRDQLIAAYTNLGKSRAEYERTEAMSRNGITPGKQLLESRSTYESDLATFRALLETLDQEENYNAMLSTHARQEAENRVAVDEASLKLLGFSDADLKSIDPAREGKELSRCPMLSPFDGTVITKDAVLMERVGLDHEIMTIADLSTVWVKADIFEQHLPLLAELDGRQIEVTSPVLAGKVFLAKVFHTGDVVDEATRTVGLRALADNADGILKPGMFVEVRLPGEARAASAIVPTTAIQEHEGKTFVFIHLGDDRFVRRDVVIGRRDGNRQEVVSGLKPSESVVTKGGFAIKSRMLAGSLAGD